VLQPTGTDLVGVRGRDFRKQAKQQALLSRIEGGRDDAVPRQLRRLADSIRGSGPGSVSGRGRWREDMGSVREVEREGLRSCGCGGAGPR
jgi:hypothetical protein